MLGKFNKREIIYIIVIAILIMTIIGMHMMPSATPEPIVYNSIESPEYAILENSEEIEIDEIQEGEEESTGISTSTSKTSSSKSKTSSTPSKVTTGETININTATKAQLMRLPGVGEAIAQRIIDFRNANGDFQTTKDVTKVSGIGTKKYEDMKDNIVVE